MALARKLTLTAGLLLFGGTTTGHAGPDDSVWYQAPRTSRPPAPSPAPPSQASGPSFKFSGGSGSVYFNVGSSDYYYPHGTGYPFITYGRRRGFYGRYYYPRSWRYYRTYDSPDTSTLIELARRYDPALIGVDPNAEPPTNLELGQGALRQGVYADAISLLALAVDEQRREETEESQPNRQAQRLLGIAYAAAGQYEQAGEQFAEAFETDASLRTIPLRGDDLFNRTLELNSIVSRAVGHAHRNPSYESWFTVAVLMQAQGRNDLANTMIQRAEAARTDAEQTEDTPGEAEAEAKPDEASTKPETEPETEAERLRRELRESTERLHETQRRLDEMKRKQKEAESETESESEAEA